MIKGLIFQFDGVIADGERTVVFLDEVSWMGKYDPDYPGELKYAWDNRFKKQSGIFNIFMYHSEMEHISCDLAMLRRYAQTGATSDFLATSACAKREILAIRDRKVLKWENIF